MGAAGIRYFRLCEEGMTEALLFPRAGGGGLSLPALAVRHLGGCGALYSHRSAGPRLVRVRRTRAHPVAGLRRTRLHHGSGRKKGLAPLGPPADTAAPVSGHQSSAARTGRRCRASRVALPRCSAYFPASASLAGVGPPFPDGAARSVMLSRRCQTRPSVSYHARSLWPSHSGEGSIFSCGCRGLLIAS